MNEKIRWWIGSSLNSSVNGILSNRAFPLTRYFPCGYSVFYDIQRFSQRKQLNVLLDIGANVGQTANGLVRYFPKSGIYCFEPVSATFNILSQKFSKYSNVSCIQKGMGSVSGSASIILHDNSELNTIVTNGLREKNRRGNNNNRYSG